MKILDCTLRDGGYYTNWDFDSQIVEQYLQAMNKLPIDYLEVGYRSKPQEGYLGEYFYLPLYVLNRIKAVTTKKLVVILNEKDVRAEDAEDLLAPIIGVVDMVRLAIDPQNFARALKLAKAVKKLGFELGFNVMYMSNWREHKAFLDLLPEVSGLADYFYLVDSYGGVFPEDIRATLALVREKTDCKLGFHGHNNLELGLINTLTALEEGVEMVDATITGMGRGAGNLSTELLLTVLRSKGSIDLDFNALSKVVAAFESLKEEYQWGTQLPYMVSGAHSLPQKNVMSWMSRKQYSLNSIIRALTNQSKGLKDNDQLPTLDLSAIPLQKEVVIIGGGNSVVDHHQAIKLFLELKPEALVIHASSKNAHLFNTIPNQQFFCLIGNEGHRLEQVFNKERVNGLAVLPPYPRKMGTYVPELMAGQSYELPQHDLFGPIEPSHTSIALHLAQAFDPKQVFVLGYDGYSTEGMDSSQQELFIENSELFKQYKTLGKQNLVALTPTKYKTLTASSIFGLI
jgi:4-hydroxy 2-oxovalerate aldolase